MALRTKVGPFAMPTQQGITGSALYISPTAAFPLHEMLDFPLQKVNMSSLLTATTILNLYILPISAAEKNPQYGNVWCAFQTVTDYHYANRQPNFVHEAAYLTFHRTQIMTLHEMWMDASPCNKLYKTSIIRKQNLRFSEDLSLGEDWLFNLAYLDAESTKKILVITAPLYNYVQSNSESLDHKYRPDLLSIYRRLNHTCEEYLKKWHVPQEQMPIFYNSRFYLYEKVLSNTLQAPNLSTAEKYRWNNRFLKSAEFQSVLKQATCYIHPLYRVSYRFGNYYFIVLLNFLQKCKKLLLRKRCSS